jgi:hypothetical protein
MGVHTWRNAQFAERERAYLSFLSEQGYTLSAVEQLVVDGGSKPKSRRTRSRRDAAASPITVIDGGATVEGEPSEEDAMATLGVEPDDVA